MGSLEGHGIKQWETGVEYASDRSAGRSSTDKRDRYQRGMHVRYMSPNDKDIRSKALRYDGDAVKVSVGVMVE